jgi:hypothetical protein
MRYSEIIPHPRPESLQLVVRLMPAIYNRFPVDISDGPPFAEINLRSAQVSYPDPLADDGTVSMDCLLWLVEAVRNASASMRFPICIVLDDDEAVYFEPTGEFQYSRKPPRGGLPLNVLTEPPVEPVPASATFALPANENAELYVQKIVESVLADLRSVERGSDL